MTDYVVTAGQVFTSTLSAGDTVTVLSGGTAQGLTLVGNETLTVSKGGTASDITISSGGREVLAISGTLSNTRVLAGGSISESFSPVGTTDNGLYIGSGGKINLVTGSHTTPITADAGALIEFGGVGTAGAVISSTTGSTTTLTVSVGAAHQTLVLAGAGDTYTSGIIGSGTSARDIFTITCFLAGTQIRLDGYDAAIETIQPGDSVAVVRDGKPVMEPVIWVGSSSIDLSRHAHPERAAPIRVRAGALGHNIPARDLLLSPEHCLILDDRCIPVKLLANGASIAREFPTEPFSYYHVELASHGILIAEDAAAESYLDTGNRASFDNAGVPHLLHPTFEVNANARRWQTEACAPLAAVPGEVAPVWQKLAERSVELGWQIPVPVLIENPDLHIVVDGKRIQPTSDRGARYVFMVPAGAKSVTLASRFCIPADKMVPGLRDTRRLGVSVDWMAIRSSTSETIMPADHPALTTGWNEAERDGAAMWRWTDGAASIPWDGVDGSAVLTIRCTPVGQYPLYDEKLRLVA